MGFGILKRKPGIIQKVNDVNENGSEKAGNGYEIDGNGSEKAGGGHEIDGNGSEKAGDGHELRKGRQCVYRICLFTALIISVIALTGILYYSIDCNIPSVIHVRAGEEESFHLGVPAKAEIIGVSDNGISNIPEGAVEIDLSKPVTMKADFGSRYSMQVNLFGIIPLKQVGIRVIEDKELIPVGTPVGIYVKTKGILVVGPGEFQGSDGMNYSPGKHILKSGDYIRKVNGQDVSEKEELISLVRSSGGKAVSLTVERNGELIELSISPRQDANGEYKIGVWVRDNAQGVGTMTYIDSNGGFGALGHGITDVDTSTLMHMGEGTLYQTEIVDVKKGTMGHPGEMTGMIIYSNDRILGTVTGNNYCGIFGECNINALSLATREPLPIGLKQEIEKGPGQILCTVDGVTKYYDIEITDVHLDHDNVNRGIELKVTDSELLQVTGGIIQGMSGSPIIQNGKIIGAVTHVLINDPTRGYGIFIETMLEH